MDKQARTGDTVSVKSRQKTDIGAKHCRGGWGGRRGKDDRKQNTLAPLLTLISRIQLSSSQIHERNAGATGGCISIMILVHFGLFFPSLFLSISDVLFISENNYIPPIYLIFITLSCK